MTKVVNLGALSSAANSTGYIALANVATSIASGTLLKSTGSGVTSATAAEIVAAIGATAVTNATNATSASSASSLSAAPSFNAIGSYALGQPGAARTVNTNYDVASTGISGASGTWKCMGPVTFGSYGDVGGYYGPVDIYLSLFCRVS